jgi:hypothetical protein
MNLCPHFPHVMSDLGYSHRKRCAYNNAEQCENQCMEGRTFLVGVNEITFTHVP